MPKNRIATRNAKHSKLPLPRLCITADRRAQLPELIDVSADLTVTDSAGFRKLRDCCAAEEKGFRCAELLELCCKRKLCVGHLSFQKVASPDWTDKSRCSLLRAAPDWRGNQLAAAILRMRVIADLLKLWQEV